jgi:hypothetical protein
MGLEAVALGRCFFITHVPAGLSTYRLESPGRHQPNIIHRSTPAVEAVRGPETGRVLAGLERAARGPPVRDVAEAGA